MAVAIKGTVLLRRELTFLVCAYRRKRKKFSIFPDHKESKSAEPVMDPLICKVTNGSRVHNSFRSYLTCHGLPAADRASGAQDAGQAQKPSSAQVRFPVCSSFHRRDQYSKTRLVMNPEDTSCRAP